ncbi:reverse transcriptase domain-containing protein, partial [Tanacetum coccineum]
MGLSALWMLKPDDREPRQSVMGSDTWVDPRETTEEVALVTLEGVNTRDWQTHIYQTVETLVDDSRYHNETARLLDQEALASRKAWDALIAALTAQVSSLQGQLAMALGEIRALQAKEQDCADAPEGIASTVVGSNNMPPKRTARTIRTARVAAATATAAAATTATATVAAALMTTAAIEQLVADRVSAALANHETLQNSTNGYGDGSHNSGTRTRGATRTPLFHRSNCAPENQVKFATYTFIGNALTWWNSHKKAVTQDVAYAIYWKALKRMMTVKYCPRGEIKKRMFPEESNEVEKYVSGLPDMIWGNVMSYRPQTMEEVIEFANDQMNQKLITLTERQAEQKRKLEYNAGNNQGYQQQNKRQNTGRAYTAGPGEKREYTGSFPLCTNCNYHHKGPCAPRCNKSKKIGHLARDCRSSGSNGNNNNRGNSKTTQNVGTYYECGVQGHFKRDCPKLKNKNYGNQ